MRQCVRSREIHINDLNTRGYKGTVVIYSLLVGGLTKDSIGQNCVSREDN